VVGLNPSHPKLLALLAAGVTPDEIGDVAREDRSRGKGMAWVLAVVEARRKEDAAAPAVARGGGGGARASPAEVRRQQQDQWLDELLPTQRRKTPKDVTDERTLDATPRLLG